MQSTTYKKCADTLGIQERVGIISFVPSVVEARRREQLQLQGIAESKFRLLSSIGQSI